MKLIIASVIILFGVVIFLFALFPADMSITRIVRINAPKDSVWKEVGDLRTWIKWNELIQVRRRTNSGNMNTRRGDSNHINSTDLKVYLLRKTADSVITKWEGGSAKSFLGNYIFFEDHGEVVVQWNLEFHLHWYPWEKLASMYYDKELGPLMEHSLVNLRNVMENAHSR